MEQKKLAAFQARFHAASNKEKALEIRGLADDIQAGKDLPCLRQMLEIVLQPQNISTLTKYSLKFLAVTAELYCSRSLAEKAREFKEDNYEKLL